ncbi:hypothetical protein [Bacillus atrophaeus]|uniref:hypothetical protein n=1 Tax=Bacillus atrophaeus TaxID=1452 RepID=UPI0038734286
MNNGEFVLGNVFPIFQTTYRGGEIDQTFLVGYEIEYSIMSLKDKDKPDFKIDGSIPFPESLLGETYEATVKNVVRMLKGEKEVAAYEVFGVQL